jgi:YegS/Rv2252/BmrU family lipid kinase
MKTCVIFNPAARGEKAEQFHSQLAALSTRVGLKPTYAPGTGQVLAAEAVREGYETVVAAGGDGTLNEVVNGIGDGPGGFGRVRLGVLPLGTINVFARELRLPMTFEDAWRVIEKGRERVIDLPWAEFSNHGQIQRRYFVQLAGAGLDSRAIELVDAGQKKVMGPLAYVVAGFKALSRPKPQISVSSASERLTGELVLIGNGRYYGGNFELFPRAELTDGRLDVTVFPKVNWEVLFRSGWGWLTDQLHQSAGCQTFQAESFNLESSEAVPFELEGDNVGQLPARFGVQPRTLRVLVA